MLNEGRETRIEREGGKTRKATIREGGD